jgi:hypothetical protein
MNIFINTPNVSKEGLNIMNHTWKLSNYLIPTILSLVAFLTIFCTWGPLFYPLFLTIYNNVITTPQNGFEGPMRVVGVNYPTITFVWLSASFVIFLFVLFFFAKRSKASSGLFWINGISISIILSHIIMWISLANPF